MLTVISPSSVTMSPTASARTLSRDRGSTSGWNMAAYQWRSSTRPSLWMRAAVRRLIQQFRHTATGTKTWLAGEAVVDGGGGGAVDPAVQAHGDRHETVAGGVVDVDCHRTGVASGAHRAEAHGIDGVEHALLHRRQNRLGVGAAERAQHRLLGQPRRMVE